MLDMVGVHPMAHRYVLNPPVEDIFALCFFIVLSTLTNGLILPVTGFEEKGRYGLIHKRQSGYLDSGMCHSMFN